MFSLLVNWIDLNFLHPSFISFICNNNYVIVTNITVCIVPVPIVLVYEGLKAWNQSGHPEEKCVESKPHVAEEIQY